MKLNINKKRISNKFKFIFEHFVFYKNTVYEIEILTRKAGFKIFQ